MIYDSSGTAYRVVRGRAVNSQPQNWERFARDSSWLCAGLARLWWRLTG